MKTPCSDLKVNRNIYPDAVIWYRMLLIDPKSGQLGPISHCLVEESQWQNELFLSTQDWVLSLHLKVHKINRWKASSVPDLRTYNLSYLLYLALFSVALQYWNLQIHKPRPVLRNQCGKSWYQSNFNLFLVLTKWLQISVFCSSFAQLICAMKAFHL